MLTVDQVLIPMLTCRQPWAECIAGRWKPIENRPVPTTLRGWLAIHAGRRWVPEALDSLHVRHVLGVQNPYSGAAAELRNQLPTRAVVAVARLVDCHLARQGCCAPWGMRSSVKADGGHKAVYHWKLLDAHRLTEPITMGGHLGVRVVQLPARYLPPGVVAELVAA